MLKNMVYQQSLFPKVTAKFPSTRYLGSKAKIINWIIEKIVEYDFETCLDVFGGSGVVAYNLKKEGKQVTYNDILRFNYYFAKALIENSEVRLDSSDIDWLLQRHLEIEYPTFIQNTFHDIYFTDEENAWLDQTITNIQNLSDIYKFSIAFFALCQACIIKRPYNLFHRKNLYIRLSDVQRSFGNKTTWDKPFENWFCDFIVEANQAIFDNGQKNTALNIDAFDITESYDLVYIDTPYISSKGVPVDYHSFYHFLEGLTMYDSWKQNIDKMSKHRRLKPMDSVWIDKRRIYDAFDQLFEKYSESIIVVSYRSDGIPSNEELISLLRKYKHKVRVELYGNYKYVLSTNSESQEILLIGI